MQSERGIMTTTEAINLTAHTEGSDIKIATKAREQLCKQLIADGWLHEVDVVTFVCVLS